MDAQKTSDQILTSFLTKEFQRDNGDETATTERVQRRAAA
jgi:hypothetical protein